MNKRVCQKMLWIVLVMCGSCETTTETNAQVHAPEQTVQAGQVTIAHIDITSAFTDPELLAVIRRYTGNQVLYADEVARITQFWLGGTIHSLAGLEHLRGLQRLSIISTSLEDVRLPELPVLQQLEVSGNRFLRTLTLSNLPALQELEVSRSIGALHTVTLSNLPMLQKLYMSGTDALQTVTLPQNLSSVRYLGVGDDVMFRAVQARWSEIAPRLESLTINGLSETDNIVLSDLPVLRNLIVYENRSLQTLLLSLLPALQELYVENYALQTVTLPQNLSSVRYLSVGHDVMFRAIQERWGEIAPHLESLRIIETDTIITIMLPSLPALQKLKVSYNNALQTLTLPSLPALQELEVSGNRSLQTVTLPQSLSSVRSLGVGDDVMFQAIQARWAEIAPHLESLVIFRLRETDTIVLPNLPMLQELRMLTNTALRTLTFQGVVGSASINTQIELQRNALRSLAPFERIVQHQDATIRSSFGRGDTLDVDEELIQNVTVLTNAGVVVQSPSNR